MPALRAPLDYRWAHAVNDRQALESVSRSIRHACEHAEADYASYVNAVEADIIWSDRQQLPVMGHPPETDSELTLQQFLQEMQTLAVLLVTANAIPSPTTTATTLLIVKLDFKSARAFQASFELLRAFVGAFPRVPRCIFVNADILLGPATTPEVRFDAHEFLRMASALSAVDHEAVKAGEGKIVLSVGWTTSNTTPEEVQRPYTEAMVDEMLSALEPFKHLPVTFPLRATSFRVSWPVLQKLLRTSPTFGFTLWWAKTEMSATEMEWLYHTLEEEPLTGLGSVAGRTFYDIAGFDAFLAARRHHE